MMYVDPVKIRIHEFELRCLLDQIEWWKKTRIEILIKDNYPDQIEFTNEWVAILTREEDLPF